MTDLDKAVEDFKNHTLRGKAELGDDDWQVMSNFIPMLLLTHGSNPTSDIHLQAEYVEALMRMDALVALRRDKAANLAAVDSAAASLFLVKASSEKEWQKLVAKLASIENRHAILSRWARNSAPYMAGLEMLRDQRVAR